MRRKFLFLLLSFLLCTSTHAQNAQTEFRNIGDAAPPLKVAAWLKGTPVSLEKGQVYVVEFWATWCKPCIAMMPHLSNLALLYKDRLTIIGVNVKEKKATTPERVKAFVDSMGPRINYPVAIAGTGTWTDWLEATGEQNNGIPRSFVVDGEGRLAWIGHPKDLDTVLGKIVMGIWDIQDALALRNEHKRLRQLDRSLMDTLNHFAGNRGNPRSALSLIREIVAKEPTLEYAPIVAYHTFAALLQTDPGKAYEYGKALLLTPTYEAPDYDVIISNIDRYRGKRNLPLKIYALGAAAYRARMDMYARFGNMNIPKNYKGMADMYFLATDREQAIAAMQKAIEALKREQGFSKKDLRPYTLHLEQMKRR